MVALGPLVVHFQAKKRGHQEEQMRLSPWPLNLSLPELRDREVCLSRHLASDTVFAGMAGEHAPFSPALKPSSKEAVRPSLPT